MSRQFFFVISWKYVTALVLVSEMITLQIIVTNYGVSPLLSEIKFKAQIHSSYDLS